MILTLLAWYLVIQLIALAVWPLARGLFAALPDQGWTLAKALGILLMGVLFWLGYSYGLVANERGGAWLALLVVAGIGGAVRWRQWRALPAWLADPVRRRYVGTAEALFAVAFLAWAVVRMYDPAANHTEQPMDLMFLNSIWASATYPPRDAWLAGYAISYYYLGYWLLAALARLAGGSSPLGVPAVAYNVGQAAWFGLLLLGSFGMAANLLAVSWGRQETGDGGLGSGRVLGGGLLAALAVGVTGNLQGVLEWLYANGLLGDGVARWFQVHNFPANAAVTGRWYIGFDWWWWRSARVLQDLSLTGEHVEVIDEFPFFSYLLGDNHPHVLAMPFVLLAIGLAMALFLGPARGEPARPAPQGWMVPLVGLFPLGGVGLAVTVLAVGALLFLNTWDFPPYWLLLVAAVFVAARRSDGETQAEPGQALSLAAVAGVLLVVGAGLLYLPYFLTAQSQAGGVAPNLLHPTRLRQFLLMFGGFLPAVAALLMTCWRERPPARRRLLLSLAATLGLPALWLLLFTGLVAGGAFPVAGELPSGAHSFVPFIVARWSSRPWTFLLAGSLLAVTLALIWERLVDDRPAGDPGRLLVLLLTALGLALVYAPEFLYLRDYFGTRMNTVFKFYYQGWLLLALSSAYTVAVLLGNRGRPGPAGRGLASVVALGTLLLICAGLVYPVAGVYSKTGGFGAAQPTLDAGAYLAQAAPAEYAAAVWVQANVPADARVLEAKGASYRADFNRISTLTGRPTLLGWDFHEVQWRGEAYGAMARGRPELLELIYRTGTAQQIREALDRWQIDYVYVGPAERSTYQIAPRDEARLSAVMDLVFEEGDVRIYQRRSPTQRLVH